VTNQELREARLDETLARLLAQPLPEPPPIHGASVAADRLLAAL
jgi:hypothetical protein